MLLRHALRPLPLPLPLAISNPLPRALKPFTTSALTAAKSPLPPLPKIPDSDLTEAFLKGSGPGGQKINKTSSAVQLKHLPTGLVIKSQATRSRSQNRKIARRLLAEKLEVLEKGPESRVEVRGEVKRRMKASKGKKARRKYREMAKREWEGEGEYEDESGSEAGGKEEGCIAVEGAKEGENRLAREGANKESEG